MLSGKIALDTWSLSAIFIFGLLWAISDQLSAIVAPPWMVAEALI